jgi:DNA-binding LacI/PurR family transcriptional regulator
MWNRPTGHLGPNDRVDHVFAKCAMEAGLLIQEKWMPAVPGPVTENKGYEFFLKFWKAQEYHPDGMVICDDILASGVLRAVLHKQIKLPEQIRLISFATDVTNLPFHQSVTRYEYSVNDAMDLAVQAIVKLLEGQQLDDKSFFMRGKLIEGSTA